MKDARLAQLTEFHTIVDRQHTRTRTWTTESHREAIVPRTEWDIGYRFTLHQHPYVPALTRRLLTAGVAGLQAADTEDAKDGQGRALTLPQGLEVQLPIGSPVQLAAHVRVALLAEVVVQANGVPLALDASMQPKLESACIATATQPAAVAIVDSIAPAPRPQQGVPLPAGTKLVVRSASRMTLPANTRLRLYDGNVATLAQPVEVVLMQGTQGTLGAARQAEVDKVRTLPKLHASFFDAYAPSVEFVQRPHPVKDLDFTTGGAYSAYNWELFFHVPLTIALQLGKNQRYAEAQRWFHHLFDPTDDSDGEAPDRFWKVRPFRGADLRSAEDILTNLATNADPQLRAQTLLSIEEWKDKPFRPHVIARHRHQAYMHKTVMAYLDNLVAWGDSLFREDTGEAIDEAMMLYVLAANILGPRPLAVPTKGSIRPQTYANLRADLNQFGAVLREVEGDLAFDLSPMPTGPGDSARIATVRSIGKALYFGVPRNDKLMGYWDTVADRLFKIRNSLNLQGTFRQLALFAPPIDPGMLARAAAAGLDVGAIVSGASQPLPLVRFQLTAQKAGELCQEVKALGGALLSAMEKEDGEALAALRARHERLVMAIAEQVKYGQLQEATKAKEGLLDSIANARQRYIYYERLLGKSEGDIEGAIPDFAALDKESLHRLSLRASEPAVERRPIAVDVVKGLDLVTGGHQLNTEEAIELGLVQAANVLQMAAVALDLAATPLSMIPQVQLRVTPFGIGAGGTFGGVQLSSAAKTLAEMSRTGASLAGSNAGVAAKMASYTRREQEWAQQSNAAAGEITQTFKQLRAAEIREAVAELELKSHRQQMRNAEEAERFLNEEGTERTGKRTNKALYAWMKREVRGLYAQSFQLAFDAAKRAERALQLELGKPDASYIQYGYMSGKEGLLAGERLQLDLKRMEVAYHELNRREYELTKQVSLQQVDPLALVELRATGRCTVRLPEALFDLDGPGHYFRRIKTVAVSIPCVTGPYASVNCTLTLLKSAIRTTPVVGEQYARSGAEDPRFTDYLGSMQSIVTSSGQNDSGLFEPNLRDERYLPFENSGVDSEWQLSLPANPSRGEPQQFDYSTISDVVLHIRYTAREGGGQLRQVAKDHVADLVTEAKANGCIRLFSLRHEFPTEWARFKAATGPARTELAITLRPEHYPIWSKGRVNTLVRVDALAAIATTPVPATLNVYDAPAAGTNNPLARDPSFGNVLRGRLNSGIPPTPTGTLRMYLEPAGRAAVDDLWIAVTWQAGP